VECSTKNLSTPPEQLSGRLNGTVKHTMFCYPRYADYFITTKQIVQNTPCFIPAVTLTVPLAESKSKAEYEAAHSRLVERKIIMANREIPYKIYLEENELPRQWYNVRADMKNKPAPLLNPATHQPCTLKELSHVFCTELAKQELDDTTPYIDIPQEIIDFYKMYRPAPLVRAYCLEKALGTPAKIYYKFEGNNTSGSHKLNSAIAQAYYAKKQGLKGVTTETGAGQWGTALSMACAYLGLDCKVFMVKCSYEQKPFRREVMRTYGANVTPSPSMETEVGKKINAEFPGTTGSLGCAISEAVECATTHEGYRYVLGSVLSQVLLHQTVIGLETKTACEKYGIKPDMIIGCAGGGSNLGGLISPFMGEKLRGEADYEFIAVEPASCPSLTRGVYAYDFCDTGAVCPLAKMYTLGSTFIPSANHAGGLRYHGMSSVLSQLYHDGYITARSVEQTSVFAAAEQFARTEGILPAPESSHAIRVAIDEAMKCKETGEEKTILFGLTGTGYFDMVAYQKFNDHEMSDYIPTDEELKVSMERMPKVD
jgi:tryptophan synthase beta chain